MNNQICRIGRCCVFLLFYVLCMCLRVFTVLYCLNRKVSNHLARVDVSAGNSLSTPQY